MHFKQVIVTNCPHVLPVKQETLYLLLDETAAPGSSHHCMSLAYWPVVHRWLELCLQSTEKKVKHYKSWNLKLTSTITDAYSNRVFIVSQQPVGFKLYWMSQLFRKISLYTAHQGS